jgi:hypothetical protein
MVLHLWIFESAQLSNDEEKYGLDLRWFLVWRLGREYSQNVRDAAGDEQLHIPKRNILLTSILEPKIFL